MKIILKIIGILLCLVIVVIGALAAYNAIMLRGFYAGEGQKEFIMAGYSDPKYDQQGLDVDDESGLFFYGGYMKDKTASRIYLVDPETGKEQKVVLLANEDGTTHVNHSGGLAVMGDYVYMAGSKNECLFVFDRREILAAENGASVRCLGTISLRTSDEDGIRASFIGRDGNTLYVGEFQFSLIPQYCVRNNHKLSGPFGKTNALMAAFTADPSAPFGLSNKPVAVYALPSQIQGVAAVGDQFVLSGSLFHVPSRMETVTPVRNGEFELLGVKAPLYSLQPVKRQYVIPMSEGIVNYKGKIYISSELDHYIIPNLGKLWGGEWCWSVAQ